MNGNKLESVQCVKDLIVTVASILKFSQQCKGAAGKANRMQDFIRRNISIKNKDAILPLYISLVRPHLENTVPFWTPHDAKDIAKLETVQRRTTKMITFLRKKKIIRGKTGTTKLSRSRETTAPKKNDRVS